MFGVLVIASCAQPDSWAESHAVCAPPPDRDGWTPGATAGQSDPIRYSEACKLHLLDALGVSEEVSASVTLPGSLGSSELAATLGAAWVLLEADYGTVAYLLAWPDLPPSYREELTDLASAAGRRPGDPASSVLFEYLAVHVKRTEMFEGWGSAYFERLSGTLHLPSEQTTSDLYYHLAVILHEPTHAAWRNHIDCETGLYDPSGRDRHWDSATGATVAALEYLAYWAPPSDASRLRAEAESFTRSGFCGREPDDR